MEPGIYFCENFSDLPSWAGLTVYRVWSEEDGQVRYIKEPHDMAEVDVDIKEFAWLKLTARLIDIMFIIHSVTL